MKRLVVLSLTSFLTLGLALPAWSQSTPSPGAEIAQPAEPAAPAEPAPEAPIPFEGGSFTIQETADGDKILAYDGQELARNYVVYFDRTVTLGETNVALFDVGDGGNQCGPATVIIWKPKDDGIRTETIGEDCGAPPAAATEQELYFVPYLIPGSSREVLVWSPEKGLRVSGMMIFTPQPGTGWQQIAGAELDSIVDAFDNEAVYAAARKLLGSRLTDFATGLLTGGSVERTTSGILFGSGCVPHACGSADAFMAVDTASRKLYLAQTGENPEPETWPPLKTWPADMRSAMKAALQPQQ